MDDFIFFKLLIVIPLIILWIIAIFSAFNFAHFLIDWLDWWKKDGGRLAKTLMASLFDRLHPVKSTLK
jgi:hypothetical protein